MARLTTNKPLRPGAFLVGGDWAIAHGDADGLAHVAAALGRCLHGPVVDELRELSELCQDHYDEAFARWLRVRSHVCEALEHERAQA